MTGNRGTCPLDALEPQAQWREGERPGAKCCKKDSRQDSRITRQTGNGNAHMVVDPDQLLLVRGKLAGGPLVLLASCFPSVPSAVLQVCASGCRICLLHHLLLLLSVSRRYLLPVCSRYTPPSALSNPPASCPFPFPLPVNHEVYRHTFNVKSTACVLLRRPIQADPCFTASRAYSIWCSLPWGDCHRQLVSVQISLFVLAKTF